MADRSARGDRRGLTVLPAEECLERIRTAPVGRVAFAHADEIIVLPVNHVLDGTQIAFQTTWGSKLQVAADGARVSFEADGHDVARRAGWSVLVHGPAGLVHDQDRRARLQARAPIPWIPAVDNMFWVVISPEVVSGREIRSASPAGEDARRP